MGLLEKSIRGDGFIGAMTSAADGEIIAGSARLEKSAEVFGVEAEPIVIETDGKRPIIVKRTDIPDADDERAKRLAIADNRVQEVDLEWDTEVLQGMVEFGDVDLGEWWNEKELADIGVVLDDPPDDPGPQIDRAEELREKWGVETGQLWRLGEHRLICGDSVDADVFRQLMNGDFAVMVWTDPPYGVNYGEKLEVSNPIAHRVRNIENDNLKPEDLEEFIKIIKNLDDHRIENVKDRFPESSYGTHLKVWDVNGEIKAHVFFGLIEVHLQHDYLPLILWENSSFSKEENKPQNNGLLY